MNWNLIGDYDFEVQRSMNDDKGFTPEDSLTLALSKLSSDGWLRAIYNIQINGRLYDKNKIELPYEAISQLNEQQILDYIRQKIEIKHNLVNYKEEN